MSNILLVDDNPQNLAALTHILTEHGYRVRTAISGQVALTSIRNMLPDLILLDIRMPEMDGFSVCRQLKHDPATQAIPILFLSALDDPVDKIKAFDVGGVDYITKPFQTDEVVARVETHLTLRLMQQQLQTQNRELAKYRDHLQELVNERTLELSQTNARLHDEIAERNRIERALRVSEEQYRLLAEHVKDGIVIMQHGTMRFANSVFAQLVGRPVEQLLQRELETLFPDRVTEVLHGWLTADSASEAAAQKEIEALTGEGQTIWVEMEQSRIVWNSQPALLLTVRDIHQCKLREIRLEEERARLRLENLSFKTTLMERYRFGALVGKSAAMQRVYELIVSAAASDVNVMIVGESGTGKELIARTLHQVSARKRASFTPVNCASIPETLFEREFFGHRKGTFTGADRDKPGFFDRADQGVLFLDEVTELNPAMQAKLLRVLQDGEYFPLGSTIAKQANVLLITATNKDWQELIEQGKLRKDFFYRVCVIEIRVPPLRERKEDLPLLIERFLEQYHRKQQQRQDTFIEIPSVLPGDILDAFYAYDWPGNVRELQNVLQRYLATRNLDAELPLLRAAQPKYSSASGNNATKQKGMSLPEAVKAFEKQYIADALLQNQQHKIKTARSLGIPRSTLFRKLKDYQLQEK